MQNKIETQTNSHKTSPYRVLSLDGGGMRGLYTASVLRTLAKLFSKDCHTNNGKYSDTDENEDKNTDKDIGKGFDLIVGTSTGGILACALAMGIPIQKIIELYSEKGSKIFTTPFPRKCLIKKIIWVCKHKAKPANSGKTLKQVLDNIFGDETVGEMYSERKIAICIPAINLVTHKPRIFKTPHNPNNCADNNRKLADICLATSAAPILFPIACTPSPDGREDDKENFVDGGLWMNNPTLVGLIEALHYSNGRKIEIVSVGTCSPPAGEMGLSEKEVNKGIFYWKGGIGPMELSMNAQLHGSEYITDFLANSLNKLYKNSFDKHINIERLHQSPPSAEQAESLNLDQSNKKTCQLLRNLGTEDGKHIYGEINRNNNNIIKSIFTNLPNLKGE